MSVEDEVRGNARSAARRGSRTHGTRGFPRPNSPWLAAIATIVAGLALFALYYAKARTVPLVSDGASNALQAWDMVHGNLLLHGWALSDVSFYTTELPEYALIELLRGLNAGVVHIAAALTYTLLVLFAALLAKGGASGRNGLLRAAIAGGIMLAPTWDGVLSNPNHTGTMVPVLAVWLIVDRARPRLWVPAAAGVLLAWVQVADPIAIYEGALPLAVVSLARVYRRRVFLPERAVAAGQAGGVQANGQAANGEAPARSPGKWWQEDWYELSLAGAAVISAGAAELVLAIIRHVGGFTLTATQTTFNQAVAIASHAGITFETVLVVFSADFSGTHLGSSLVPLLHLAVLALAVWSFGRACRRFMSQDLVVQGLVVTVAVLLLAFMFRGDPAVDSAREIVGILPAGAVLAGRVLGPPLTRARLLPVLTVLVACCLGSLVQQAVQAPPPDQALAIGNWLRAHNLTYGLSNGWQPNSITLASQGRVQVRAVERESGTGTLVRTRWQSDASWYAPTAGSARFFLIVTQGCPRPSVTLSSWVHVVRAEFGLPATTFRGDGYEVFVYNRNLLQRPVPSVPQGQQKGNC